MPDRHGPMRVVYEEQGEGIPSTTWSDFEGNAPNDVLDRITRGILNIDPAWLGSPPLTSGEVTAVEEAFGVTIGPPDDGGEPELPSTRFRIEQFQGSGSPVEGGIMNLFYKVTVSDGDDDDDVTGFRLEATSADEKNDSFENLPDGPDTGAAERSNPEVGLFTEQAVETPVSVTLSAADEDSSGEFVELTTQPYPEESGT
ncbi:hypothetical protein SAMN04488066_10680 [Halorubrum aquaticum]|uniref:Uncharacterized protein n=1 Tax=Halorubrum aquaticum TaxID=387340 RepID=A0A1I3AKL3_9EURY|nr:hypothetical protein [Halorubrum aquaticum]SFH50585.1 hypothetical protein SAMN04488066_10680 [Halorubrum aquaticum]